MPIVDEEGVPRTTRAVLASSLISFFALLAIEIGTLLFFTGGAFVYSLDDAYIHLALAEGIASGNYGINPGEFSAPSSSVLWPFLLAPFASSAWGHLVPLVLNVAAGVGALFFASRIAGAALAGIDEAKRLPVAWMLGPVMVVGANLAGLCVAGMEHTLQVCLAAAVVAGLVRESVTGEAPRWLLAAIVAGPLVRYENLALSVPALLLLRHRGHAAAAAAAGCVLAAILLAFSLWIRANGAGLLPTSVIAKMRFESGPVACIASSLLVNLENRQGALMFAAGVLLLVAALDRRRTLADRSIAAFAAAVAALHLAVGQFGWLARYEAYAVASLSLLSLHVHRVAICGVLSSASRVGAAAILAFAAVALFLPYGRALLGSPYAARDNFEIHCQVQRFLREYHDAPAAVCDVGLAAYRNERYVLDYGGLAHVEAGLLYRSEQGGEYMDVLASRHGVELAIVYPTWFPAGLPARWVEVATLRLRKGPFARDEGRLGFYACTARSAEALRPVLARFRATLPEGLRLTVH